MEQVLAASKSSLISSLDFGSPGPVADYVTSRQSIQVFPQGSNIYSPQGVKQLRFSLGTQGAFVDMSSLAIQATFTNGSSTQSCTILGPSIGTLIQEARVYMGNIEVERVNFYNRTESMLSRFLPFDKRAQMYDEGFGFSAGTIAGNDFVSAAIPASSSKTVIWRPQALGLCNQRNYIPTAFVSGGGVVIELLLTNTAAEVCDSTGSTNWTLSDAKILVDVVNCDPGFLTSMSKHLLSGGSLTLNTKCYNTVLYSVGGPTMTLQHVRAFTRLNSFFLTFFKTEANTKKLCNTFYLSTQGQNISVQAQIGERQIPDNRTDNIAQHFHRMLHTIGVANSATTINITRGAYGSDSFISATDCEAVPEAHASGMSTHNAPLVLDVQHMGATSADLPSTAYLLCFHECLVEISQEGVSVAI
jgi:hypothetical protein